MSAGSNGVSFSLFTGVTSPDAFSAYVYQTPRLALDYELASHITLGAALGLFLGSSSQSGAGGSSSARGPGSGCTPVAPRVGYMWSFSDQWAFWPRAGLSFYQYQQNISASGSLRRATDTQSGIAIDLVDVRPAVP